MRPAHKNATPVVALEINSNPLPANLLPAFICVNLRPSAVKFRQTLEVYVLPPLHSRLDRRFRINSRQVIRHRFANL